MPFFSMAGAAPKAVAATAARLDEQAFRLFYERTARPLRRYLLRMLNDASAADDLLQESYLRLLKAKLPEGASEEHAKNYLFRIATNLIKDRKTDGRETAIMDDWAVAGTQTNDGDMTRMLGQLKPAERELLWLAYVEGFNHSEIAGMMGLRPASVRPLLWRARHALASVLRQGGFGGAE